MVTSELGDAVFLSVLCAVNAALVYNSQSSAIAARSPARTSVSKLRSSERQ
jgi:hypothetical protein